MDTEWFYVEHFRKFNRTISSSATKKHTKAKLWEEKNGSTRNIFANLVALSVHLRPIKHTKAKRWEAQDSSTQKIFSDLIALSHHLFLNTHNSINEWHKAILRETFLQI